MTTIMTCDNNVMTHDNDIPPKVKPAFGANDEINVEVGGVLGVRVDEVGVVARRVVVRPLIPPEATGREEGKQVWEVMLRTPPGGSGYNDTNWVASILLLLLLLLEEDTGPG